MAQRPDLPPPPPGMVIKPMEWQQVKGQFLERFQELEKGQALSAGLGL